MKIALIGPGIMPIPPTGWGAVEILIWDYYNELTRLGHIVTIINTKYIIEIINIVNRFLNLISLFIYNLCILEGSLICVNINIFYIFHF
jgi:hypothetical protein